MSNPNWKKERSENSRAFNFNREVDELVANSAFHEKRSAEELMSQMMEAADSIRDQPPEQPQEIIIIVSEAIATGQIIKESDTVWRMNTPTMNELLYSIPQSVGTKDHTSIKPLYNGVPVRIVGKENEQ